MRLAFSALIAAAILALFAHDVSLLTTSPCIGVADNHNFTRVTRPAGIKHPPPLEPAGQSVRCQFRNGKTDLWSAPSSAAILALIAKELRFLGPAPEGSIHLRQMGLLYLALVAAIIVAGVVARFRLWLALLLLYVLSDPGYLLFFNSFYADGALLVALLGTVIWFERFGHLPESLLRGGRLSWAAALSAFGFLMLLGGGSKMLFVLLPAVVLVALGPLLPNRFPVAPKRIAALALMLVGIGVLVFWNFYFGRGPRFVELNNFHAVYGGILSVSTKPEAILEELGVPREQWMIERTDAWAAGVQIDHPVHLSLRGLSRLELLRFYLADPPAAHAAARAIERDLLLVATHPRGTYPRSDSDRPPAKRTAEEWWQFSNISRRALHRMPHLLGLFLAGVTAWVVAAAFRRSWSGLRSAMLFLLLWFFSQSVLAVLGEGLVNLHQHLLGARLGLDFLITLFAVDLAQSLASRAKARWRSAPTRFSAGSPAGSSFSGASTSA